MNEIQKQIIEDIKALSVGEEVILNKFFERYNVLECEREQYYLEMKNDIESLTKYAGGYSMPLHQQYRIKKGYDEIYPAEVEELKKKFDKLDYDFFFEYSLFFGKVKAGAKCFAILTRHPTKLFVIEDQEKCRKLFKEFLEMVKKSKGFAKSQTRGKTGIEVKERWGAKIRYLFKKRPSEGDALKFFAKIFKENGFDVEKIYLKR